MLHLSMDPSELTGATMWISTKPSRVEALHNAMKLYLRIWTARTVAKVLPLSPDVKVFFRETFSTLFDKQFTGTL